MNEKHQGLSRQIRASGKDFQIFVAIFTDYHINSRTLSDKLF
jgi:hypothetical protein